MSTELENRKPNMSPTMSTVNSILWAIEQDRRTIKKKKANAGNSNPALNELDRILDKFIDDVSKVGELYG